MTDAATEPKYEPRVCDRCSERIGSDEHAYCDGCVDAYCTDAVMEAEEDLGTPRQRMVDEIRELAARGRLLLRISEDTARELEELARELEQGG